MDIKILLTGGIIDKSYNQFNGNLYFNKSYIDEMLKKGRSTLNVSIDMVFLKDSLDMNNNNDRENILKNCFACKENKIIITHGTDSMITTAMLLGENIKEKTIVIFGAMIPYSVSNSDAFFNLGCAISGVQILKKGVYVIMNGKIFFGTML